MSISLVVMVVHFCAISQVTPFFSDCTVRAFPMKGQTVEEAMANCKTEKADWDQDRTYKRYFSEDRPSIKHRELAIVAPIHCELQREHDWETRAKEYKEKTNEDNKRDIQKELNEVSPIV